MLDDDDGGGVELGSAFDRGIGVVEVVVGKLLALCLGCGRDPGAGAGRIEGRCLVRVFAIAQELAAGAGNGQAGRVGLAEMAREPGGYGRVISGGARIGGGGERAAQRRAGAALGGDFRLHRGVLVGRGEHGDEVVVLGRGTDQCRAADIDVLDAGREIGALRDRFLERVEVDDEKIDRGDGVRLHLLEMGGVIAASEQAAMDLRHQRFHPPVQDLREPGVVRDFLHRDPRLAQRSGGAAGGKDLDAGRGERLGQGKQPGLVGDGDQGAANWGDVGHESPVARGGTGRKCPVSPGPAQRNLRSLRACPAQADRR